MRSLVLPAALVVVAVACADLGGLSTGATAVDAGDAGPSDAGAFPPPGSIGDSGADAIADAGRFCATFAPDGGTTLYCRDFDDGDPAAFGWTSTTVGAQATFALDPDNTSPPNGARSRLEKLAASGCEYARGQEDLAPTANHVRVSYDVKLGGTDTVATTSVLYAVVGLGPDCDLLFSTASGGGRFLEQIPGVDINHAMSRWPLPGTWSHLDVDVDRAAATVDVHVDGKPAFTGPQVLDSSCKGSFRVQIGLYCMGSADEPFEARYDNLVVTQSP